MSDAKSSRPQCLVQCRDSSDSGTLDELGHWRRNRKHPRAVVDAAILTWRACPRSNANSRPVICRQAQRIFIACPFRPSSVVWTCLDGDASCAVGPRPFRGTACELKHGTDEPSNNNSRFDIGPNSTRRLPQCAAHLDFYHKPNTRSPRSHHVPSATCGRGGLGPRTPSLRRREPSCLQVFAP